MPLRVLLSSTLRQHVPHYDAMEGLIIPIQDSITVREVCRKLKIPEEAIKIVIVDGKSVSMEQLLKGDERVALFPSVGGG